MKITNSNLFIRRKKRHIRLVIKGSTLKSADVS
jgi:hypothetical protein